MTIARLILLVGLALGLTGCIRRTITIHSQPSGALVYLNDEEVGRTPTTVPFTFYGVYDVRLVKEGYATLHAARRAEPPLYDQIGIDLFTEMLPGDRHVDVVWDFQLAEAEPVDPASAIERGRQLRALLQQEADAAVEAPHDPGEE